MTKLSINLNKIALIPKFKRGEHARSGTGH